MGEQNVHHKPGRSQLRAFTKALLDDVQALDRMLADNAFESGVRRIGAEQEMFLVDRTMGPAMTAVEVLETLDERQAGCSWKGLWRVVSGWRSGLRVST